jgi:hypothetical protein
MQNAQFVLSARGLATIPVSESRNDFEFIVGDNHYFCSSFVADFLSPLICRLHSADETVSSFRISAKDDHSEFGQFLSLGRGSVLMVTGSNFLFLTAVCEELENLELHEFLVQTVKGDVSCLNIVGRINSLERIWGEYIAEISFAASHFFEISASDVSGLSFWAFSSVVEHASLKLSSENSLFEFISERIRSDKRFFELLQFVRFEFLSLECFTKFFDLVRDSFDCFAISHWESLRARLLLPVSPTRTNGRAVLTHSPTSPLQGIIVDLAVKCGGNVHDHDVVRVTCSSGDSAVKTVADVADNSVFE